MNEFEKLAHLWQIAKQEEEVAREKRVQVETKMLALQPAREEGSETMTTPLGIKIKTTGKLNYKADLDKLAALTQSWPEAMRPIKAKVEADELKLKLIRSESPDLWRQIAPAIETKAAKVSFSITFPNE